MQTPTPTARRAAARFTTAALRSRWAWPDSLESYLLTPAQLARAEASATAWDERASAQAAILDAEVGADMWWCDIECVVHFRANTQPEGSTP